ncbi:dihydrolipoamide acetyltransferase family protein [Pseudonocardia phyllosphaerae]|uniref:dihydrolipoamide acetyltransferase family protein n=1 Tax=Pseudonocardia phyllosphaerae TaxID=3390502 RepID=UPI00397A9EA7
MRELFNLPDVGEGLTEAEIVTWRVQPGDTVAVNDVIVEIETAKAAVELPSPWAGTVQELLAEPGVTLTVGTPIIAIDTAGGAASSPEQSPAEGSADGGAKIGEAGKDGRIATLVGYGPRQGSAKRRPRRGAAPEGGPLPPVAGAPAVPAGDPVAPDTPAATAPAQPAGAVQGGAAQEGAAEVPHDGGSRGTPDAGPTAGAVPLAPPPVRMLARELGVDLRTITGSGPHGRITRDDVQAASSGAASSGAASPGVAAGAASGVDGTGAGAAAPANGAGAPAPVRPAGSGDRREPIRGVRRATAAAMVSSAFTAPHVTEFLSVDVTETMALRERLKASRAFAGVKLTPLAFVAKAVCLAAARTPAVNASWDERAGEIVYYERVQLGIAAATPRGLVVPKIRDADRLGLRDLAEGLSTLTDTARAGKTAPADLVGGTFTISNVGVLGVDTGTPILNPGEAAILAVGSIKQAPWVVDGELAVRTVCQLALSFDHRVVDGAEGSQFLADVGALLEDPGIALTW